MEKNKKFCDRCGKVITGHFFRVGENYDLCPSCCTPYVVCDDCGKTFPEHATVQRDGLFGVDVLCDECDRKRNEGPEFLGEED